ncbi:MAG: gluconeogenesis factor YvcK family protein [Peptococcaceae bacterium]
MEFLKWLYPGLGIKRWLALGIIGFTLVSVGMAIISDTPILGLIELYTKGLVIDMLGGSIVFGGLVVLSIGSLILIISFKKVVRAFIKAVFPEYARSQVRPIHQERLLKRGPRIVVIGGGTGLSVLLRGLKEFTSNITAIVSVADDGGSSGRLRDQLGILPPGDVRNCLIALADKEALMEKVLNYRFKHGDELAGHNLGNLFLAAMSDMYGNFEEAVRQMSRVLAIRGKVIPSTLQNVVLNARLADGTVINGESNISAAAQPIKEIFIRPEFIEPLDEALEAINEADAVILGPGSLFTSVIPNLLISGIPEAVTGSKAVKIYVCNVMTQPGETLTYTAGDHLEAIYRHIQELAIDYILVNDQRISDHDLLEKYISDGAEQVVIDSDKLNKLGVKVLAKPLLDETKLVRHNSRALGAAVIEVILTRKKYRSGINLIDKLILLEKTKS